MDRPEERLALIELSEPLDRQQRALRSIDVRRWPVTIGRAFDNDVVLDDPHVAPHHARLSADADGQVALAVLTTGNGVQYGERRIGSGETTVLPPVGASVQLGHTRLRIRLPAEVLAPEQALAEPARGRAGSTLLLLCLLLALQLGSHWLSLDPGADLSAWLPSLVGLPLAIIVWVGFWALLSKLFLHRFDFGGHLRIAVPWLLLMALVELAWPRLAAALDLPLMWQLNGIVQALLGALLVRAHLIAALPTHRTAVGVVVAAMFVAAIGVSMVMTLRQMDSIFGSPYMSTLPQPAWRLGRAGSTDDLLGAMAPLQTRLIERVQKARDEEEADSAPDDGD